MRPLEGLSEEDRGRHIAAWALEHLVGTPYLHQGRVPGPFGGIDCFGVLVAPAVHFDLQHADFKDYDRDVDGALIKMRLARYCDRLEHKDEMAVGDILLFALGARENPCHFGILTPGAHFIHARERMGSGPGLPGSRCENHPLTPFWRARIDSVWRYRWRA